MLNSLTLAATLSTPLLAGMLLLTSRAAEHPPASQEVTRENYAAWGDFIRPSTEERKYEQIGWRNSFWPAVLEARQLGRPVLLWTMNGHPLGCT